MTSKMPSSRFRSVHSATRITASWWWAARREAEQIVAAVVHTQVGHHRARGREQAGHRPVEGREMQDVVAEQPVEERSSVWTPEDHQPLMADIREAGGLPRRPMLLDGVPIACRQPPAVDDLEPCAEQPMSRVQWQRTGRRGLVRVGTRRRHAAPRHRPRRLARRLPDGLVFIEALTVPSDRGRRVPPASSRHVPRRRG
jgi:hypothetical protein